LFVGIGGSIWFPVSNMNEGVNWLEVREVTTEPLYNEAEEDEEDPFMKFTADELVPIFGGQQMNKYTKTIQLDRFIFKYVRTLFVQKILQNDRIALNLSLFENAS
jgi:hypothetical protein